MRLLGQGGNRVVEIAMLGAQVDQLALQFLGIDRTGIIHPGNGPRVVGRAMTVTGWRYGFPAGRNNLKQSLDERAPPLATSRQSITPTTLVLAFSPDIFRPAR